MLVGGHSRVTVDATGTKVQKIEAFSKSCLTLDKTPDNLPKGATVEALFATHIVDEIPAPTHVYLSMLHKIALYVGTAHALWVVNGPQIHLAERRP